MANGDQDKLSGEDLTYLLQARSQLLDSDPRGARLDAFIKSQLADYVPPTTGQPIPPGLQGGPQTKALQYSMGGMPQYVDVPASDQQAFEAAGRRGNAIGVKAGMASTAIPSAIVAPGATALAAGTGYVMGKGGKLIAQTGAKMAGASPENIETAGDVGEFLGNLAGGYKGFQYGSAGKNAAAAGQTIGQVMQQAGKQPVNTAELSEPLHELMGLKFTANARIPGPAKALFERLTNPGSDPLTVEQAKTIQGELSNFLKNPVDAKGALIKDRNIYRLAGQLNGALKNSIDQASQMRGLSGIGPPEQGGFAPGTFAGAMRDMSLGAARQGQLATAKELLIKSIAKKAVEGGAMTAGGAGVAKILHDMGIFKNLPF